MSLFDLDNDNTVMNIDGKDIEMKHPICHGKEYDRWLVSKCGKVWSLHFNKLITGRTKSGGYIQFGVYTAIGFWEDGSGTISPSREHIDRESRDIVLHKIVMDTWAPLYDNPPEGIAWEEWEIVRKLPSVFNHISKTVVIDHIDDVKKNNHLDNLRRSNSWDNNYSRKAKGI